MTKTPEQEDKSLKVLKSIVLGMGVLLVVGTIALFVAIIIKANSSGTKIVSNKAEINECHYKKENVTVTGNVISANNDGNILTVVTSKQVVVYDICSGKTLAKFYSVGN